MKNSLRILKRVWPFWIDKINSIENAFPLSDFYCPPNEILKIESHRPRRGHFNIIHNESGFKADVYIHNTDKLQEWGLSQKTRIKLNDEDGIWVAPPEYVIARKLEYYREGNSKKHLHDISGMLEVSGDIINKIIIQEWITKLHSQAQWDKVKECWNMNSAACPFSTGSDSEKLITLIRLIRWLNSVLTSVSFVIFCSKNFNVLFLRGSQIKHLLQPHSQQLITTCIYSLKISNLDLSCMLNIYYSQ